MEISKTKASIYANLKSKKMRIKYGMFIVEGEKCILDTIGAFELVNIVSTKEWLKEHSGLISDYMDCFLEAADSTVKKISTFSTPSEVIAVFKIPEAEPVPELSGKLVLALDGIQDPGNLGTIIRTADWFGVDAILASKDTVDLYNAKTVQATMGSLKRVKVYYTSLPEIVKGNKGMPVYGTLLNGKNIYKTELSNNGIIVMGNEGNGISDEVRSLITDPLLIPPYKESSHGESLNVAIATAITLSIFRNR